MNRESYCILEVKIKLLQKENGLFKYPKIKRKRKRIERKKRLGLCMTKFSRVIQYEYYRFNPTRQINLLLVPFIIPSIVVAFLVHSVKH